LDGNEVAVMGLTAADDLDLDTRVELPDEPGETLRLVEVGAVAVVEGDELEAGPQPPEGGPDRPFEVLVGGEEAVVGPEDDRLAGPHPAPVESRVPDRLG